MSKNVYVSEADRDRICNGIAHHGHRMILSAEESVRNGEAVDMVDMPNFRRGYLGMEEEQRRLLAAVEDSPEASLIETDWDVEAVVDEDQL